MTQTPLKKWAICPKSLFDGEQFIDRPIMMIEGDQIASILSEAEFREDDQNRNIEIEFVDQTIIPGLFDIQVNGGGGIMFNSEPYADKLETMFKGHLQYGTTNWLPTFITDEFEKMQLAVQAIIEAQGKYGIKGVHLEGPFLNKQKKGTHKESFIREIDDAFYGEIKKLRDRQIKVLVTIAPECAPKGAIERLKSLGVRVSAGHSMATETEARAAIDEGLDCLTHLYNAMPEIKPHDAGLVGVGLDSAVYFGIIADGYHVDYSMIKFAYRAKKDKSKMIVVSDAMATVGGDDYFTLYGENIYVKEGRLVNQAGSLAGAHVDMLTSMRNLIFKVKMDKVDALKMATSNPAKLMGVDDQIGYLRQGSDANFLVVDDDFVLQQLYFEGQKVDQIKDRL